MQGIARTSAGAAVLVLVLAGCGDSGETSEADLKDEIAEQLEADGTFDAETAECFADIIVDVIGADELDGVDFSASEPPEDLQEDYVTAARRAVDECDIDPESLGG